MTYCTSCGAERGKGRTAELKSEVLDGVGVGVRLLRILGAEAGIFDPTPTPKSNSIIFQHALPVYFYLLHKQSVHGLFDHETLGRCCKCF